MRARLSLSQTSLQWPEKSMSDENVNSATEDPDSTSPSITYTQVVSCALAPDGVERRRQGLRARLEREHL
ncbi:MAG: hypothetical protein GY815_07885 [Gammaproteobacteria bacterium]|nr:hypothetical protein [Gammaproteobacteria bacterium]